MIQINKVKASPSARRKARELGIDISQMNIEDNGGRINAESVVSFAEEIKKSEELHEDKSSAKDIDVQKGVEPTSSLLQDVSEVLSKVISKHKEAVISKNQREVASVLELFNSSDDDVSTTDNITEEITQEVEDLQDISQEMTEEVPTEQNVELDETEEIPSMESITEETLEEPTQDILQEITEEIETEENIQLDETEETEDLQDIELESSGEVSFDEEPSDELSDEELAEILRASSEEVLSDDEILELELFDTRDNVANEGEENRTLLDEDFFDEYLYMMNDEISDKSEQEQEDSIAEDNEYIFDILNESESQSDDTVQDDNELPQEDAFSLSQEEINEILGSTQGEDVDTHTKESDDEIVESLGFDEEDYIDTTSPLEDTIVSAIPQTVSGATTPIALSFSLSDQDIINTLIAMNKKIDKYLIRVVIKACAKAFSDLALEIYEDKLNVFTYDRKHAKIEGTTLANAHRIKITSFNYDDEIDSEVTINIYDLSNLTLSSAQIFNHSSLNIFVIWENNEIKFEMSCPTELVEFDELISLSQLIRNNLVLVQRLLK